MTKIVSLLFLFCTLDTFCQKPYVNPLDTASAKWNWPVVDNARISNDGHYVAYIINNEPVGASTLVVRDLAGRWNRSFTFTSLGWASFSTDSKLIVINLSDSLLILSPGNTDSAVITDIASYKLDLSMSVDSRIAYLKKSSGELVVRNLKTEMEDRFENVNSYSFSGNGRLLAIVSRENADDIDHLKIEVVNFGSNDRKTIWNGSPIGTYCFDYASHGFAFISTDKHDGSSLWYYNDSMIGAKELVHDKRLGVDSDLILEQTELFFDKKNERVFYKLREKERPKPSLPIPMVDIWNYKDRELQSRQLRPTDAYNTFLASTSISGSGVSRLQYEGEDVTLGSRERMDHIVVCTQVIEPWLQDANRSTMYWVSTSDGKRKVIEGALRIAPPSEDIKISPSERWVIYFNGRTRSWCSYDAERGIIRNISKKILYPVINNTGYLYDSSLSYVYDPPVGVAGWMSDDTGVLIYDDYDIWLVDLSGNRIPVNMTGEYGRNHHIKFRLVPEREAGLPVVRSGDTLLLSAFDIRTKLNGFYRLIVSANARPEKLFMGPCIMYANPSQLQKGSSSLENFLLKARDTSLWVISRRSDTLARNFYITHDFKSYDAISHLAPQKKFNWLTTTLIRWKPQDGDSLSGILYKPENFNPLQKYPVIIHYYEGLSDELYNYPDVGWSSGRINIPFFVSRGYIICEPDIHMRIGHPGAGVLSSIVSLAKYISGLSYIDAKHIGITGHSFGGFETNYLVTHTNIFSAAVSAAGLSDYISAYTGLYGGTNFNGSSMQFFFEAGQGRIGASLWQSPNLYIENSPIFRANHVSTPLLMMHNKRDGSVSFSQGVAFFTSLRRLNKPVWLLQYDKGVHIVNGESAKDFTIRTLQFFDHYLRGAAPPLWMTEGIPARWKGLKSGLELDRSDKAP